MPKSLDYKIIDLTPENISDYGVCGYKDVKKHLELRRKIDWFKEYYPKGLRIKAIIVDKKMYQGMIEYIPGEYAHRPVSAAGYLFIHCVFVGFKKEFKGKGLASALIDECIAEANRDNRNGVAVVTRNGSFMAKKDIFVKKGFVLTDTAPPDFELMTLKLKNKSGDPKFIQTPSDNYSEGLTIIRSPQCPYSVKNVDAIMETSKKLKLKTRLLDFATSEEAQNSPCAFGTFCIVKDGSVISHHPISNTRFVNIINSFSKKAAPIPTK